MISFSVSLSTFRNAFAKLAAIIRADSVSQIRSFAKFTVTDSLLMGGSNLEQSVVTQIPILKTSFRPTLAAISHSLAVPADKISKLLSVLTADVIDFRSDGDLLAVACGAGKWQINLADVAAYPPLVGLDVPAVAEVESLPFRSALSAVLPVARKATEPRVPAVTLDVSRGLATAFDGRRKSGCSFGVSVASLAPVGSAAAPPIVIPVEAASRIATFMGGAAGQAELGANGNHFRVAFEDWVFSTTMLAEKPVTWSEFPFDNPRFSGSFPTRDFLKSLDQATVFSEKKDERGFSAKIHLDFSPNILTLFSPDSASNSKIPVPIAHVGLSFRSVFPLDSFRELLAALPEFTLTIPANPSHPALIACGPFRALISAMSA